MRRISIGLAALVVAAAGYVLPGVGSAGRETVVIASASCTSGYVRASLTWGVKCLRAGESCKVGNAEYHPYGFTCPATGHLKRYVAPPAKTTTTLNPGLTDHITMPGTTTTIPLLGGTSATTPTTTPSSPALPSASLPAITTAAATTTTVATSCPTGSYLNVNGACIQGPTASPTVPSGATAQCKDGTYSFSQNRSGTCSGHGGVATWL
ncbi:MAG TPA: DUF3761 domain-containing protein [Gaiellaceae bacterium]|nr:DUF3761 domain-containing protein [Gaiellaceae bacterium]